jgi:putative transposase
MPEIIAILEVLSQKLSTKSLKHLSLIVESVLSMTGRVTLLSISRWTEKGGSYRTVQRFFKEQHQWAELRWLLIKSHLSETCLGTWILIGDEVVMTKSGSVARTSESEVRLVFRHNYPAKAINCL